MKLALIVATIVALGCPVASAAIFATPQPNTLHVIIDVCPDNIVTAVDPADGTVTRILTDELWTSSPSMWLFHMNDTGSLHHFDLSASLVGLAPDVFEEPFRGYNYTSVYPWGRTSEYRLLPVSTTAAVPEPATALLGVIGAGVLWVGRRR